MENYEKKKNPFVDVTCRGTRNISLEFINLRICMPLRKNYQSIVAILSGIKGSEIFGD